VAKEGQVIGATKATVGEIFDENGRQKEDVQPLDKSRTFLATDRTRAEAVTPAVGTTGAASTDVNTGTGSQTSSASASKTPTMRKGAAHSDTSAGTGTADAGSAGAGDSKKNAE
jgi:hypothetical protein